MLSPALVNKGQERWATHIKNRATHPSLATFFSYIYVLKEKEITQSRKGGKKFLSALVFLTSQFPITVLFGTAYEKPAKQAGKGT